MDYLKNNPVRVYAFGAAIVGALCYFLHLDDTARLVIDGVVVAGLGLFIPQTVTPESRAVEREGEAREQAMDDIRALRRPDDQ